MHRALQVDDIVHLIVEMLAERPLIYMASLALLARVSKIFWRPCCSQLWMDLTFCGMDPLLRLLPAPSENAIIRPGLQDIKGIPVRGWQSFLSHASFVRVLHARDSKDGTAWNETSAAAILHQLEELVAKFPHLPIFPKLKRLLQIAKSDDDVALAAILLAGPLEHVILRVDTAFSSNLLSSCIRALPTRAPLLRSIELIGVAFDDDHVQSDVAQALVRLPELRKLNLLVPVLRGIIPSLAGVKKLEELDMRFTRTSGMPEVAVTCERLQQLSLYCPVREAIRIIASMMMPSLHRLDCRFTDLSLSRPRHMRQMTGLIADTLPGLRALIISPRSDSFPETGQASPADFEPLLRCRELVHVRIGLSFYSAFRILWQDDDVLRMARSWPALQELHLRTNRDAGPGTTLESLSILARHCESLRSLVIDIDSREVAPSDTICPPAPGLHRIMLGKSSVVPEERVVSDLVETLWPNAALFWER